MQLCNETITVFNASLDADDGYDVYTGTIITGASWHCEVESSVDTSGTSGLKAANKFTIRIPEDADFSGKTYADPVAYASGTPASQFTLKNGDIIVKGEVSGDGLRPAELLKMHDSFTILGVTDNRRAKAPHWKVVGS